MLLSTGVWLDRNHRRSHHRHQLKVVRPRPHNFFQLVHVSLCHLSWIVLLWKGLKKYRFALTLLAYLFLDWCIKTLLYLNISFSFLNVWKWVTTMNYEYYNDFLISYRICKLNDFGYKIPIQGIHHLKIWRRKNMYDKDHLFSLIYLILAYFTIYSTSADPLRGYEGCNPPPLN